MYEFLIFLAAGDGDDKALRDKPFVEFAKLLGMRMARTVLSTSSKHLIKTR